MLLSTLSLANLRALSRRNMHAYCFTPCAFAAEAKSTIVQTNQLMSRMHEPAIMTGSVRLVKPNCAEAEVELVGPFLGAIDSNEYQTHC